jgi:hypothetical protein
MKTYVAKGLLGATILFAPVAFSDTPKPTQAEARANIEAQVVTLAQAKCAKEGKVALGKHVNGAFMVSCVSADDPEYKAQQSAKPAQ